jgi:hypothetical protein
LNKVIYYIGFYSPSNQELIIENRTFSSAAVNLMNFVSNQLSINCSVHILSPAWSLHSNGFYSGKKISITKNVFLHLTPSFGSVYKIGKLFSKAFAELWLLGKIILMVKKNDKLIAYHSIANSLTILLARKIIGFTLVLQLNEIYQDVENLGRFNNYIENIEAAENLKNLRSYLKANGLAPNTKLKIQSYKELFKRFEVEGFEILVGKNSKNNDLLTQQYAYKEDLWLHARDATGSHVVLKYRAGKKFPNSVIETAASLAAYFSKRRNETMAPVIVTPKKFVRKPKGSADGQVIVEKEEVVMVEPKLIQ